MNDAAQPQPRLTAEHVRAALTEHFAGDGAVILHEVGNGTGHRAVPRWVDMMVMETWPSRGYCVHGIEIKVARSDWKKELATPAKADAMFAHCDRWWLASTPGVVEHIDEIPKSWGWIEIARQPKGISTTILRQAASLDRPRTMDREIVAAMLRAHSRRTSVDNEHRIREEVERRERARLEDQERQRAQARASNAPLMEMLTAATGRDAMWLRSEDVVRAFTIIHKAELHHGYNRMAAAISAMRNASETAGQFADALEGHLVELGLLQPKPPEPKRRRKPL